MNKKAQKFMLGLMFAVILFVGLTQLITPLKDSVRDVRDTDQLNCTNPNLSTGESATCVMVDWSFFYFLGTGLAVVAGFLAFNKIKSA